jgi:hypothetical protein
VPYAQQGPCQVLLRLRGQVLGHPFRHDDLRHHHERAALDAYDAALSIGGRACCPRYLGAQTRGRYPRAARRRRVHRLVVDRARAVAWGFRLLVLGPRCGAQPAAFERGLVAVAVDQLACGTNGRGFSPAACYRVRGPCGENCSSSACRRWGSDGGHCCAAGGARGPHSSHSISIGHTGNGGHKADPGRTYGRGRSRRSRSPAAPNNGDDSRDPARTGARRTPTPTDTCAGADAKSASSPGAENCRDERIRSQDRGACSSSFASASGAGVGETTCCRGASQRRRGVACPATTRHAASSRGSSRGNKKLGRVRPTQPLWGGALLQASNSAGAITSRWRSRGSSRDNRLFWRDQLGCSLQRFGCGRGRWNCERRPCQWQRR